MSHPPSTMDEFPQGAGHAEADAPFTPVRSRKRRRNQSRPIAASSIEAVEKTMEEMRAQDTWLGECKALVCRALDALSTSAPEILCLGLGSPSDSRDARAQCCFIAQIRDSLQTVCDHIARSACNAFTETNDMLSRPPRRSPHTTLSSPMKTKRCSRKLGCGGCPRTKHVIHVHSLCTRSRILPAGPVCPRDANSGVHAPLRDEASFDRQPAR